MADYLGDLYAIFQNPPPPTNTNTTPPCLASFTFNEKYNEDLSFPNILQQPLTITSCLHPLVPPPPINTNTRQLSLASFTFNEEYYNEAFSFPINTNTIVPSLATFNEEYYNDEFSIPINTNTTPPSLDSLIFNEEYLEAFYFPTMVQQPLIITDEYADVLDQMLATYSFTTYTTTSTTTTSSNNGIILNPNSPPDLAGQSHHLPPNPVLLAPPSKEHEQKQQKQVFQVQASRAFAKGRKSEQKTKVFHATEDNKLSSDSWAWRKYGQKSSKGTPNPRKSQPMKRVFHVTEDKLASLDLWAWRKYGKKSIKGTPYPRNYFKCSSFKNCPAQKRVERSNIKAHMFIVTYKGEHSHLKPTQQNPLAGTTRSTSSAPVKMPKYPPAIIDDGVEDQSVFLLPSPYT